MIQIQQLKLPITHSREDLEKKITQTLRIPKERLLSYRIAKQSIDARKKQEICYIYTIEAHTSTDQKIVNKLHQNSIRYLEKKPYQFKVCGNQKLSSPPVIVGSGPAGLFCAYMLAQAGYAPIVLERGKAMEDRKADVQRFWDGGVLNENSNVQFGEGGAGTFSDGKLNTLVKDTAGRNQKVLEIFTAHGAPEEICYAAKPHIGTDLLEEVIPSMRKQILAMGGTFLFEHCLTDLKIKNNRLSAIEINHKTWMDAQTLVLAIGHSARDTFAMLRKNKIPMEAKPFAVGLRVEHLQERINRSQYGKMAEKLPPAAYKLTANGRDNRGVYTFCMCPGGYVVNASSEKNRMAINGMSYHDRNSANANSAVIVSVTPKDFGSDEPLAGVSFQRGLEEKAFSMGGGCIPQQLYGDFKGRRNSNAYRSIVSVTRGAAQFAPLHELFGQGIYDSFVLGMEQFARKLPAFDSDDVVLSGVESRTSSPVKIPRDDAFESECKGIYPCGEGAGYAGGIMSAAMDGIKAAEAIAAYYLP